MMTCRDAAALISSDEAENMPLTRRQGVRLHLIVCRNCRRFRAQLQFLGLTARVHSRRVEREMPSDLPERILSRASPEYAHSA